MTYDAECPREPLPGKLLQELDRVTRQRDEALRDLALCRDAAQAAKRARLEFIANVNHEFRTPLNAVLGFSALLVRELSSEEQLEKARHVHEAARALDRLMGNVLDFAQFTRGTAELRATPFDLDEVLERVFDATRPLAREKGLGLEGRVGPEVPRRLVGDAEKLRQIVASLLDNALKFTEQGSALLQTSLEEIAGSTATLRITVSDTGVGIPRDRQESVFEEFTQADGSATRRFGGLGLGLALARRLVEACGGKIGFHSVEGEGSTFWAVVPFEIDATACPPDRPTTHRIEVGAASGRRSRILVVDDDRLTRTLVELLLVRSGYAVDLAAGGREALEILAQGRHDLVLMDIRLPDLDGREAVRMLRSHAVEGERRLRIIAMTADTLSCDRQTCREAGVDDFLAKPFAPDDLLAMVRANLPGHPLDAISSLGSRLEAAVDAARGAAERGDAEALDPLARQVRAWALEVGWSAGADQALRLQLAARRRDATAMARLAVRLAREPRGAATPPSLESPL